MIELLAKGALAAAAFVFLGVAALTLEPKPVAHVEFLPPAEVVTQPQHVTFDGVTSQSDNLKAIAEQLQRREEQAARISGKLDLLLGERVGLNAKARPRPKPGRE